MKSRNRNILLFLDNAASHPRDICLTNITLEFLPPNTTSICQHLDQGIIQNFKVIYRNFILKDMLSNMDTAKSASELSKKINVLDALCFVKASWDKIEASNIENCFRKSGFIQNSNVELFELEDDIPLATLFNLN